LRGNTDAVAMKRKSIAIVCTVADFLFLFALGASAASSLITRFIFITDPQAIKGGELSGALTVQAQDAGENSHKSDETIDLVFSSTSSTGEFLNAAGGPVDPVMNKNTANRTFYYRDTASGAPTLTVKAMGRISIQSWTASQSINIEKSVLSSASSPIASSAATSTSSAASSYHAPVAPLPPVPTIQAFAGEDRIVLAGVEGNFIGEAIGLVREPITGARFWWNFGDGETAEGKSIGHTYREPGIYTIVLSVSSGEYAASDYAVARVIPNKIAIAQVTAGEGGAIRIVNPASVGADIGGWMLEDDQDKKFFFPVHTVIGAQSEAAFANRVTGLSSGVKVTLRYPGGLPAAEREVGIKQGSAEKIGTNNGAANSFVPIVSSVPAIISSLSRGPELSQSLIKKELIATASLMADALSAAPAGEAVSRAISKKNLHFPGVFFASAFALSALAATGFFLVRHIF